MAKAKKKQRKKSQTKKKIARRKRQPEAGSQTLQPFEQDAKRRIGQFGGAGEPPIMK
jgi:hypothetical protein